VYIFFRARETGKGEGIALKVERSAKRGISKSFKPTKKNMSPVRGKENGNQTQRKQGIPFSLRNPTQEYISEPPEKEKHSNPRAKATGLKGIGGKARSVIPKCYKKGSPPKIRPGGRG